MATKEDVKLNPLKQRDTAQLTYTPWTDGWAIGFEVTDKSDGHTWYVYLNPSGGNEDRNVFIYTGPCGDVQEDTPHSFIEVGE